MRTATSIHDCIIPTVLSILALISALLAGWLGYDYLTIGHGIMPSVSFTVAGALFVASGIYAMSAMYSLREYQAYVVGLQFCRQHGIPGLDVIEY